MSLHRDTVLAANAIYQGKLWIFRTRTFKSSYGPNKLFKLQDKWMFWKVYLSRFYHWEISCYALC